jgi:hypothetical protein
MGIPLASGFTVGSPLPLDDRDVVADQSTRDAIITGRRYLGMKVYVVADKITYQLQDGITNSDWVDIGSGGGAPLTVQTFTNVDLDMTDPLVTDPDAYDVALMHASTTNVYVYLPATRSRYFSIKKTDSSAHTVTILSLSATVEGSTVVLTEQDESVILAFQYVDGVSDLWYVVARKKAAAVDATTLVKGVVQLAGDLAGTAASPTVPGLAAKAPLASPALTGSPTAPTQSPSDNSTNIATTAFVQTAIAAIGAGGTLLRITSFTSSGTWTKQSDVGRILVMIVGGGGGGGVNASTNGGAGGTTTFTGFISATGGGGGGAGSSGLQGGGIGGTGSSGDVNVSGENGSNGNHNATGPVAYAGAGGSTFLGSAGAGGRGHGTAFTSCQSGGGGGGFAMKLILAASLPSTVTVTVGAAGTSGTPNSNGKGGLVIVYEYS